MIFSLHVGTFQNCKDYRRMRAYWAAEEKEKPKYFETCVGLKQKIRTCGKKKKHHNNTIKHAIALG